MNYREHLVLGSIITIIAVIILLVTNIYPDFSLLHITITTLLIFLGPLVMDLDHHESKLREVTTFIGITISLIGVVGVYFNVISNNLMIIGILLTTLGFMLCYITSHRGITHSITFTTTFSLIMYITLQNKFLTIIAFISVYSHLIGDKLFFKLI